MNSLDMNKYKSIVLLTALLCMPAAVQAQNMAEEVRTFMESRDREIKEAIRDIDENEAQHDRAIALINDGIDFEEMGRLALGRYDEDLSDDQRKDFVETFAAIVRAQSLADLSVYNAIVTYDAVSVTGNKAYVRTWAKLDDTALEVEYLLHRKGEAWWLYDIIIDGVGTVQGYATSFQTYIRKRGFDQFMAGLHKRLARQAASG